MVDILLQAPDYKTYLYRFRSIPCSGSFDSAFPKVVVIVQSCTVVPKKYPYFSSRARTLQQQFSESNEPFLGRSDIFSDATDLKTTLVLLFLRHLLPQSEIN